MVSPKYWIQCFEYEEKDELISFDCSFNSFFCCCCCVKKLKLLIGANQPIGLFNDSIDTIMLTQ